MSQPHDPSEPYRKAVAKGQKLLDMMRASDSAAGALLNPPKPSATSEMLSQTLLEEWGYIRSVHPYDALEDNDFLEAMSLLNLTAKDQSTALWMRDQHDESVTRGGIEYWPTSGDFSSWVDRANGLLIAENNHSPAAIVAESGDDSWPLPKLKHWSDVVYLQWTDPRLQHLTNDLRKVVRLRIENTETLAVIARVVGEHHANNGTTEHRRLYDTGLTLDVETEAAIALLGTPNGSGVAWLLIQHKHRLGWKVVDSVTLFWDGDSKSKYGEFPSLLFRLKDVEAGLETLGSSAEQSGQSVSTRKVGE
jgi:hypothetical protein